MPNLLQLEAKQLVFLYVSTGLNPFQYFQYSSVFVDKTSHFSSSRLESWWSVVHSYSSSVFRSVFCDLLLYSNRAEFYCCSVCFGQVLNFVTGWFAFFTIWRHQSHLATSSLIFPLHFSRRRNFCFCQFFIFSLVIEAIRASYLFIFQLNPRQSS